VDIYGERYAPVDRFIDYCRDLNVKTDRRELAYYERTGVMLPVTRVIYPDDYVVEAYRRELDGDHNWNGFELWPELADLTEKFPTLLRSFNDLADEELVHCFDRARHSGSNPHLHIPTFGDYKPWDEYAVSLPDTEDLCRSTAEHYYGYWQVHQLHPIQQYPHLYRYAVLVDRLPPEDPMRTTWLDFPAKETLREFDGMRPRFDALSFWITLWGRERARTFAGVPDENGVRKIDPIAANCYKRRLAASAALTMERFEMADDDVYPFLCQLIRLYEDYERNERYKLARKLRHDILHCSRLLELTRDQTWEQVADRLGQSNYFDRQTFRRLLTPAKERDYAVDVLTRAPGFSTQALRSDDEAAWPLTEADANALLDFCEQQGLSILRTSLSGMQATGLDERREKFTRERTYANVRSILTGFEGLLKTLPPKDVRDALPTRLTPMVSEIMRGRSWTEKFDRVRSNSSGLLRAGSPEEFRTNLDKLLSRKDLRDSKDGLCAMAFLVTCLARNFTAHSLLDDDVVSQEMLGKTLDAAVVAIACTWKLAQEKGWLASHSVS